MQRKILIIETLKIGDLQNKLIKLNNFQWCYLGDNWQIYNTIKEVLITFGKEISSGLYINKIAKEIRREYLNYERILSDEHNQLWWQTTDLAEKSLVNNSLFLDICKSLVFDDIVRTKTTNLIFIVDDIFLGEFLRTINSKKELNNLKYYNTKNISNVNQLIIETVKTSRTWKQHGLKEIHFLSERLQIQSDYVKNLRQQKCKYLRKNQDFDTLIVVWGTPNTFNPGTSKKVDSQYGCLPKELKNNNNTIAYLVIPVDWQYTYEDIINNAIDAKDCVFTLQDCFDIKKAESLAMEGLGEPIMLKERFVLNKIDFTPLLKRSFMHEKSKSRQFWALNFYYIAKYFYDNNIKINNILLGYENQPWEKSLRIGFRKWLPDTKICQYVHGQ